MIVHLYTIIKNTKKKFPDMKIEEIFNLFSVDDLETCTDHLVFNSIDNLIDAENKFILPETLVVYRWLYEVCTIDVYCRIYSKLSNSGKLNFISINMIDVMYDYEDKLLEYIFNNEEDINIIKSIVSELEVQVAPDDEKVYPYIGKLKNKFNSDKGD